MTESSTDDNVTPDVYRALGLSLWARLAVVGVAVFALGGARRCDQSLGRKNTADQSSGGGPGTRCFPQAHRSSQCAASLFLDRFTRHSQSATDGPDLRSDWLMTCAKGLKKLGLIAAGPYACGHR